MLNFINQIIKKHIMTLKKKAKKETPIGSIRINSKNLKPYEKTKSGWKQVKKDITSILNVVKLYKAEGRFKELVNPKEKEFLKGQLSPDGQAFGARINILPNGKKLDKAFSLFSPHLTLHDQMSHDHWDVIYQNKGGTYSYLYTLDKKKSHSKKKYGKVEEFERRYRKLMNNVRKSLNDNNDYMAVPMYTLLTTYMRVGNETYYKAHGHRGLTTLIKKNVAVKAPVVVFDYIGKDGVPIKIEKKFMDNYVRRLKTILTPKKEKEFVFEKYGSLLHEHDFKQAFQRYCGHEFYPHIVRSHYATMALKKFMEHEKEITKDKVKTLFMSIAHDLGHKRFNKKKQDWQENYTVTIHSYIKPQLIEELEKKIKN